MSLIKHVSVGAIALVTLAAAAGCSRRDEPSTTRTTSAAEEPRDITPPAAPIAAPALSSGDRDFITKATQGGMFEVSIGREIAAKGANPEVRAFGNHLVTDHGRMNDELSKLASSKGVSAPTQIDKDHQEKVDDIAKLTGAKLDKKFSSEMVDDHENDLNEFKKASADLKDPDLRAYAQKTIPTLEHHLQMAKDLKAKTK